MLGAQVDKVARGWGLTVERHRASLRGLLIHASMNLLRLAARLQRDLLSYKLLLLV